MEVQYLEKHAPIYPSLQIQFLELWWIAGMLPVAKLSSEFPVEQITETIGFILTSCRTVNSLICDNNWTNPPYQTNLG